MVKRGDIFMKKKIHALWTAIAGTLRSWLGILAIPVFILVGCNIIDYITGLRAAKYRNNKLSSYKSIRGIEKKICMWLLILVGYMMDVMINYTVNNAGFDIKIPPVVAILVTVWLIFNEIISILENMVDIGVNIPPFLLPLTIRIRSQVEEKADEYEIYGWRRKR